MIKIHTSDRYNITGIRSLLTNVASLTAGVLVISMIFLAAGVNPVFAIKEIFMGSFGSAYGFKETITKAIPLILIGTGLTLAFRAKFWNIGAEGQLLAGAMLSTWTGLTFGEALPSYAIIPLMFAAGFVGGALWGIIPAFLKIRYAINEVISTLMLNYICAEIMTMLIVGPWKGKTRFGFPGTDNLPDSAILGVIPGSRIHYATLALAILSALVLWVLIYKTRFGYEARVVGENPDAGKYAGINFMKTSLILMAVSGGLAGFAGTGEVAGIHQYLGHPASVSSGYGFTAIIVAWLAKLNPLYAIGSGIFFAGILVGGDAIQISLGLPAATVEIVNGIILFFLIMGEYFLNNKISIRFSKN
ncbi:ABC transporter permease [Desulfospira joergensenii]|uniref:ABC transporter permease n=1 Tax=Desulfospira joergensenii TaxID=53329 RepID=UPI0003B5AA85|nr:ABC transporter permease [Desulfospira joergensenii]